MDLSTLTSLADFEHSRKVSEISALVADFMGCSREECELIGKAARYHDVGKSCVPIELLDKAGPLTEQEYETVKQHARQGGEMILSSIRILCAAYMMAVNHHERLDGSGYRGLTAEKITVRERIVSAVDVFDALLSKRPYKQAWALHDVLTFLGHRAGSEFDKEVVAVLTERADTFAALYR